MVDSVTLEVKGLKEIVDKIRKLPDKIQKKIERGALRKALAPMKAAMEQKAPRKTGMLAESFKIRTRTKRGQLVGEVISSAPHAHLVEYGHRLVRGGQEFGFVPAYPFARPALDETAKQVVDTAADEVEKAFKSLEDKREP